MTRRRYAGTWRWRKADLVAHILQPHPVDVTDRLPVEAKLRRSTFGVLHGWHCHQHGMPGYQIHEIVAHGTDWTPASDPHSEPLKGQP